TTSSNKWNTISWVWKILRQNEQFSVIKSSFYIMRFLFYTTFKYATNE
ncbi:glycosyl transferase family 2, partial [Enterococcus faecalis]